LQQASTFFFVVDLLLITAGHHQRDGDHELKGQSHHEILGQIKKIKAFSGIPSKEICGLESTRTQPANPIKDSYLIKE
jgi:hypothetical protein